MNTSKLIRAIRQVLRAEWDPIGCGVPADEYDSYAPGILRLLVDRADKDHLTDHLYELETIAMGLPGNREHDARIAEKLLSLMIDGRGSG